MLDKETLIAFAKINNLRPWQQEKHYIQNLVLVALSDYPLVFKGGTYLWFFHGLNRFSEDLDFTAAEELPADLDQKVLDTLRVFGTEASLKRISNDARSFSFRISAKGPLNTFEIDLCHVYVEISKRETVIEPTLSFELNFEAYKLPTKIIRGMSLEEITAEKVRAVLTRDSVRVVYDLFSLVTRKSVRFNLVLVNQKLKYYDTAFSSELFRKKLEKKKSTWKKELGPLVFGALPEFENVETTLKNWVKQ